MNRILEKLPRRYLPESFQVESWDGLAPYFSELESRTIDSVEALEKWMKDASELEAVISEEACWRQIRMTCDTTDAKLSASFEFFMTQIQPQIQVVGDRLNRKLTECSFTKELDQKKDHLQKRR